MKRIYVGGKLIEETEVPSKFEKKRNALELRKPYFDAIIIIPSYNRITKLKRILRQLYTQPTDYTFKVILLNDGSTKGQYERLKDKYPIDYLVNEKNGAKVYYWKTINKLFDKAKQYRAKAMIQIDDDFILSDNFINEVMGLFEEHHPPAIMYHYGDVKEKRWNLGTNWLDGGILLNWEFLKKIHFKITDVGEDRFKKDPNISSGVWLQISRRINGYKGTILKPTTSLAYHDGNCDSKMNWMCRNKRKINTINFKK